MTAAAPGDGTRPPQEPEHASPEPRRVVAERPGEHPRSLLDRLGIESGAPRPVIVVSGGADDLRDPQLSIARDVLGPALREAFAASGAVVVDGGTAAGVMALVGAARAEDPDGMPVLIGVAPAGKVAHAGTDGTPLDPHHTHVALADSDEWGGETPLLAALAAELAHGEPVAMVLAGGGEGALGEVREAVARYWPLFVIQGTGGLADKIAAAAGGRPGADELRRTLDGADVRVIGSAAALGPALAVHLCDETGPRDEVALKEAWGLFATYDALAVGLRKAFERSQVAILGLGILATALALTYDALGDSAPDALKWLVIATPIAVSVIIALANRRGAGRRWVLLRAAAEAVKSEIYRYRTRTGVYSAEAMRACAEPTDRPRRLAGRLAEIEEDAIQSPASGGPLTPYEGPLPPVMYGAEATDDGLGRLDAGAYVRIRIADQLAYYRGKVASMDVLRTRLQLGTLVAGGVGTLLAAVGLEIWIGLTTAVAGAALAHLGYLQVDNTLIAYNRAAARLDALRREFRTGGAGRPDLETLVTRGEKILTTELGGWVAQMTDALEQLQAEQAEAGARVEQEREAKAADR